MASPTSIRELDLNPIPDKTYFSLIREWREEFIYFLMIDRFDDGKTRARVNQAERSAGFQVGGNFYGGNLKGVKNNLDYIAGLGCTAIWLSPIFENNFGAYHGYNISNYLEVDPNFGTKQDLLDLVEAAHSRNPPMRIILDVVINHSGDNWGYAGGPKHYSNNQMFDFGAWHREDRPVPLELRQERLYHKRGEINPDGFDTPPENQDGDLSSLKDFVNDDTAEGSELINILIAAHCYWIREADVDGFRVDAVKHMGPLACSRFCSNIREYAYALGKRNFFLFGEVASSDDDLLNSYIGQNTSRHEGGKTVFFGLNSVLDFRLAEGTSHPGDEALRDVIKGFAGPNTLFDRLEAQRQRALNRGEIGRYLITFVDNHDVFWQPAGRIGNGAPDQQVIAAVGYLLCSLGTACIYYGTEQGFSGQGNDEAIREAMFDKAANGKSLLNTDCLIYKEIAKIAKVARGSEALRFGRMYFREISGDGEHFGLPFGTAYTLAFARVLYGHEVLVAYNVSAAARHDRVIVDATLHHPGDQLRFLHGKTGEVEVRQAADGARFVQLDLDPHQFVILE